MTFKLFSICGACRKKKLYVAKRNVRLPIGKIATSKDYFCSACFTPKAKHILETNP